MSRKRLVEARSPEYAYLGRQLATAREALGLSQAEAAKLIGISQGTYSGYETGTRRIKLPMLQQIAKAYDVTVDWLIGSGSGLVGSNFDSLSAAEQHLITQYRAASPAIKEAVDKLLN